MYAIEGARVALSGTKLTISQWGETILSAATTPFGVITDDHRNARAEFFGLFEEARFLDYAIDRVTSCDAFPRGLVRSLVEPGGREFFYDAVREANERVVESIRVFEDSASEFGRYVNLGPPHPSDQVAQG